MEDAGTRYVRDVDQLCSLTDGLLEPRVFTPLSAPSTADAVLSHRVLLDCSLSGITVGGAFTITSSNTSKYFVQMPVHGALVRNDRDAVHPVPTGGLAVFSPGDDVRMEWSPDVVSIAVHIHPNAVRRCLYRIFGISDDGPLQPAGLAAPDTAAASNWWNAVQFLVGILEQKDPVPLNPRAREQLEDTLVVTLLSTLPNRYRHLLTRPDDAARPAYIKRAENFLRAHAGETITASDIVRAAGISMRSLQTGFRREFGMSPMEYLKDIRLANTRRELGQLGPQDTTVGAVARKWQFLHMGNFAAQYHRKFGEKPLETLRRRSGAAG